MGKVEIILGFLILLISTEAASQQRFTTLPDSTARPLSVRVLPQNFYNLQLSFVCKKEVQLQKLVSLPVYIRLGSKEYVDWLERKPNTISNRQ